MVDETPIDKWVPDYKQKCCNCDNSPTVTGIAKDKVVYDEGMCGVCTWGEAACLDPNNW